MKDERLAVMVDALLDELVGRGIQVGLQVAVMNGSAAYADLHSGVAVAVAVMRNRFTAGDITTIAEIDQLIADEPS
jgi:hypothetical protein